MDNYIVKAKHISKSFSGVMALDDVSFNLKSGEVLALLGENGAGKSTLMKILSGVYTRDEGELEIFGKQVGNITPKKAQELGIAIIHQELNMCAHLTVMENIFLGREIQNAGVLSNHEMTKQTQKILDQLGIDISPDTIVGTLSVSKQQMVEVAKAISTNAKILIMDEPTSALTSREIDELFTIIRKLKNDGCGIVYISHRLEELKHIVDRVTILRDGKYITSLDFKETSLPEIISYMVGREIKEKFPRVECKRGKKILEVKNLNAGPMVRDINLDLYEGEIVGIAGLVGAGRTETTRAIFGVDQKQSGEIILDGKPITINKPMDAIRAGIVLAPEDRRKDGLCIRLSIRENLTLPNLDRIINKFGVVNKNKEKKLVEEAIDNFQIKLASMEANADSLSGGNQQKLVVSKWLARKSRVVIFDEPTRGIDVAVKVEIYNLMNHLKQQGIGVLFVSSELPEILGISDRIIVMCEGRITGELNVKEASQDKILEYATRFETKKEAVGL
ncbi:MAG: sugar ABC transporter ATP-binding protein [Clostridiales bacterium]|jgi:ribose transport system ATP-binding protein|nr:sugar ABC transporter ATP-binding protein [Clostridiales bacterium]